MKKAIIYYRSGLEGQKEVVKKIENQIERIEQHFSIEGVFIDYMNAREEFDSLINIGFENIEVLYINMAVADEFDQTLLKELSEREVFEIRFFKE